MTCEVALFKLQHHGSQQQLYGTKYMGTREPIAPFSEAEFRKLLSTHGLEAAYEASGPLALLVSALPLPEKYRLLYYLRDLESSQARLALCRLLSLAYYKTQPALLKHEVCFVLGQIGIEEGEQEQLVRQCIENELEEDIVRHEALAAVASQSKDEKYLEKFLSNPSQLIRESALVAID